MITGSRRDGFMFLRKRLFVYEKRRSIRTTTSITTPVFYNRISCQDSDLSTKRDCLNSVCILIFVMDIPFYLVSRFVETSIRVDYILRTKMSSDYRCTKRVLGHRPSTVSPLILSTKVQIKGKVL